MKIPGGFAFSDFSALSYPMSRLFLILALVLTSIPAIAQRTPRTLLWRISGNGLNRPSYIYGTIHVQERRAFEFSDSVLMKLQECSAFAGELRIDSMMNQTLRRFIASADSSVDIREGYHARSYAWEEGEEDGEEEDSASLGFTLEQLEKSTPWQIRRLMAREQMGTTHPYKSTFLDAYLFRLAKLERKQLIGLESFDEQLNAFDSASADRNSSTQWSSGGLESGTDLLERMITLYRSADLDGILKLTRNSTSSRSYELLLTRRNNRMAERIDTLTHEQPTFVAIGVAHLPGSGGVLQLLRNRGFSVTPVKATFTGRARWYHEPQDTAAWYDFSSPEMAMAASLPIEPIEIPIGAMPIPPGPRLASLSPRFVVTIDISTGLTYMLLTLDLPREIAADRERAFSEIIGRISDEDSSEMKFKREVTRDSVQGLEFFSNDGEGENIRVGVFLRGTRIYAAIVSSGQTLLWSSDADRFFKSLRFTPVTAREWQKVSPDKGAFSLLMPGDVRRQKITAGSSRNVESHGEVVVAHEYSSGFFCMASYVNDPRAGGTASDDTARLQRGLRSTLEAVGGVVTQRADSQIFGHPAVDYLIETEQGDQVRGLVILRGTRTYNIVAGGPAEPEVRKSMDRLFGSLELLPYRRPAWKRVAIDSLGFAIDLPSAPSGIRGYSGQYGPSRRTSVFTSDEYSDMSYRIHLDRYSDYYRAASQQSFFDEEISDRGEDDSLISSRTISVQGNPGRDIELAPRNGEPRYRVRYILQGSRLYQLVSEIPSEPGSGEDTARFFDSFTLLDSSGTGDLFSNKTDRLLADLSATEGDLRKSASHALEFFEPDSVDLVRLRQAVMRDYPDEGEDSGGPRGAILARLGTLGDSASARLIGQIYPSLGHADRRLAMEALVDLDTRESLDTLANLLLRESDLLNPDDDYTLFSLIREPRNVAAMYPRILKLIADPSYRATLLHLTATAIDSNAIGADLILPYRDAIVEAIRPLIDERADTEFEGDKEAGIRRHTLAYGAKCLGYLPAGGVVDSLLELLLEEGEQELTLQAGVALLRHGVAIDIGKFQPIAADPGYRTELYQALERIGRLDCFPSSYKLQQYMAESAMYDDLVNEEEMDDPEIKFVAEREVEYKGVRGRAFLFKFRERSGNGERWYAGLAGLQPVDHTRLNSSYDFAITNYAPMDSRSIDGHVAQLLKSAESSVRADEDD
jgi:uncharacterized protein YbaP (TraB family)